MKTDCDNYAPVLLDARLIPTGFKLNSAIIPIRIIRGNYHVRKVLYAATVAH